MPAEAIHLSALHDTLTAAGARATPLTGAPELHEAARLGAIFVDLPYFESFPRALARYVLHLPQRPSRWGDIFHHQSPIAVGRTLAEVGAELQRRAATRGEGAYLQALAVGYFSHAAVDTSAHALINTMARARAQRLRTTLGQEHQEVEKFQSILFHEQRFGFDFMGTETLRRHISIDLRPLTTPGPIASAVHGVLLRWHGEAPGAARYRSWTRGYCDYVRILASPLGKAVALPAAKRQARAEVYDRVDFPARFAAAVDRSRLWVDALCRYLEDGRFDESAQADLARVVPEGTLDPDPARTLDQTPEALPAPGCGPGSSYLG